MSKSLWNVVNEEEGT